MERTILLVDDDEDICAAMARLLRRDGYRILRARSAMEGLTLLAEHNVGVIISDQRMPEMTGVEFLTQVKELYPNTIRIVLSGYADIDAVMDAINRGSIYKFFTKPWDNDVLCADISEAFRHHELILRKEQLVKEIQTANDQLAQVSLEWEAAVKHRDHQIERLSNYHPLTDLPNRQLYIDRLEQNLAHAQHDNRLVAVMLLNLDGFKQINDSYGYAIGDILLQLAAKRLKAHVNTGDTVAHLGGDDFGFVLPSMKSARATADFAQRLIDSLIQEPISVGDIELFVSASVGISLYPSDGVNANTLIMHANAALHHAKEDGPGSFQYYAPQMKGCTSQQLAMRDELHRALEREEFVLHYQPQLHISSGKITGMKALLHWNSPQRGLVSPEKFVPLLEETGLILPVGEWVLDTACKQAHRWQQAGLHTTRVAVRLSAMQFRRQDFTRAIRDAIERNGLNRNAATIELELTENLLMNDIERTSTSLKELREIGVHVSIVDFGTGYSCMDNLKRLPVTSLKIHQSFVRNLPHSRKDAAIVDAIVALGHGFGLKVVADGVETDEQLDYLQAGECDEVQGSLFSRPTHADEITHLLQSSIRLNLSAVA